MRNLIDDTQSIAGYHLRGYQFLHAPKTERILPEEITPGMFCLYFPQGEQAFVDALKKDDDGLPQDWFITSVINMAVLPVLCTVEKLAPAGIGVDVVPRITLVEIEKEPEMKFVPLSSVRRPAHPDLLLAELCLVNMGGLADPLPRFRGLARWTVTAHGTHDVVTLQASKRKPAFVGGQVEAKVGFIGEEGGFAIETDGPFPWLLLLSMLEITKLKKEFKNH